MRDILLSPELAVDVCFRPETLTDAVSAAVQRARESCRPWLYAGSLQEMLREGCDAVAAPAASRTTDDVVRQARESLAEFADHLNWLAALAEDGEALRSANPAEAQLMKAVGRLGDDAVLLTRNPLLIENCPQAMTCEQFLATTADEDRVEFIDLMRQQDRIRPELEHNIYRVLRHGRYVLGPEIQELERRLAEFAGVKHGITVASGTDSLLIALMALKIGPGDEVITVPYTWISTAEVIALLGAKPVFVDIEPHSLNMDVNLLEAAITDRTKAIMPVSLYGQCADMDRINAIAKKHSLPVLEDGAQSFGATYHGRRSCGLSTIGSTSFFPSKPLGCYGDGGAIFTDEDDLADICRQIRVHGQKRKHHHELIGINGRFDTLQAAVLLPKLDIFEEECQARASIGGRYTSMIIETREKSFGPQSTEIISPPVVADGNTSVYAQYTITSDYNAAIQAHLQSRGVPSVSYYAVPLHLQPAFADLQHSAGDFPVAESVAKRGLSLPMNPFLSADDQDRIVRLVFEAIEQEAAVANRN